MFFNNIISYTFSITACLLLISSACFGSVTTKTIYPAGEGNDPKLNITISTNPEDVVPGEPFKLIINREVKAGGVESIRELGNSLVLSDSNFITNLDFYDIFEFHPNACWGNYPFSHELIRTGAFDGSTFSFVNDWAWMYNTDFHENSLDMMIPNPGDHMFTYLTEGRYGLGCYDGQNWSDSMDFIIHVGSPDADMDGVADSDDLCLDSVFPESSLPSVRLGVNRHAAVEAEAFMKSILPKSKLIVNSSFTLGATSGCTCEQILNTCGTYGQGHYKFGCSNSVMETWVNQTGSLYDNRCKADESDSLNLEAPPEEALLL